MTTALVVLDMLNDFISGVLANDAARSTIDPIAQLAERARAADDWIVVYANDAHHADDFELAVFGEHAMAGTPGAQVIDDLAPRDGDIVVPKRAYSAFTATDLDLTCRVHEVERLVVVGQHTDCCCRHTSYDAFVRGLDVTIVSDATAVYGPFDPESVPQRQQLALDYLRTYYAADVVKADEVF